MLTSKETESYCPQAFLVLMGNSKSVILSFHIVFFQIFELFLMVCHDPLQVLHAPPTLCWQARQSIQERPEQFSWDGRITSLLPLLLPIMKTLGGKKCSESQNDLEWLCSGKLTCVDEKLIGDSGMVHIMDGSCKNGSQDLQVCEDSLWVQKSPLTPYPMYLSHSSVSSASSTTFSSCWQRHCWCI